MIAPTNQIKSSVNGTGQFKLAWGGYGYARYGQSYYGQGGSPTNQTKSAFGSTTIYLGTPIGLLLSITYPATFTAGSGATNQSKS